jgi:hypothetical protein
VAATDLQDTVVRTNAQLLDDVPQSRTHIRIMAVTAKCRNASGKEAPASTGSTQP